jgi:transmembrane sensor
VKVAANETAPDRLEQAAEWCMRLADGDLATNERQGFETWLEEDPANRQAFEQTVGVWQRFGEPSAAPEVIALRSEALEALRLANKKRWTSGRRKSLRWIVGVAAALLVIILPLGLWYASLPQVYQTGIGERRIAMLGDGSKVSLDAATRLEVKLGDDRRELVLDAGRAKFDVAKDALRPFTVRAGDQIVVATGTSFSVELVGGKAHVVLYQGHVSVIDEARAPSRDSEGTKGVAAAQVELQPGKELIAPLAGGTPQIIPADFEKSLSWESGQLTFIDEPLGTAVARVNRYSQKKVELADASLAQLKVNGVYNAGDVAAFAVGIDAVLPVQVTDRGDAIVIARR